MICRTLAVLLVPLLDGWRPTTNGYVDSEARPIRCHWEFAADETRCDAVLRAAERAWDVQVDGLGFAAPMPDDDARLDIYLSDDQTGGGAYAFGPSVDEDPDDGKMGCHAYIGIDPGVSDAELESYVVHEFNHVLQYATDFVESALPLWEGTAHASEVWTIEGHTPSASNIADFQKTPWVGLLADGYLLWNDYEIYSFYEYGAALWVLYLDHEFGTADGGMAAALWQAAIQEGPVNEPDVLDAFVEIAGGDALMEFSVARTRVGTPEAPPWSSFVGPGARIGVDAELDRSALPASVTASVAPYQTGAVYWRITGVPSGATLQLSATGGAVGWGVIAVEGSEDDWAVGAPLTWTAQGGSILVGAVNLGPPGFDGDDPWAQTSVTLQLELDEGSGEAGATSGETGATNEGTRGGGTEGGGAQPESPERGCGCQSTVPGPRPWVLALIPLFRRRRAHARARRAPPSFPR